MYKLALINRKTMIEDKFLIIYYVTIAEFMDNYWNDLSNAMDLKMEVISEDITYLSTCEYPVYLCNLKTFWLNVFKRNWRKKHALIVKRKKIKNLINRQLVGKWTN